MKLYGIPNCSTVKKSRDWLAEHNTSVEFHDFKKHGLNEATAKNWLQQSEWGKLVNRSGLTWRSLSEERKLAIQNDANALALMLEKTSVIKRPLLEENGKLLYIGFDAAAYAKIFNLDE